MFIKTLLSVLLVVTSAFAHDEGHGPKIKRQGKYGGKLASVIYKKDVTNDQAKAHYAAEMTKSGDGKLRLYFYDTELKSKDIGASKVTGTATYKSKSTRSATTSKVEFTRSGNAFEGQLPEDIDRTVSVEVEIKTKDADYIAAFPRMR